MKNTDLPYERCFQPSQYRWVSGLSAAKADRGRHPSRPIRLGISHRNPAGSINDAKPSSGRVYAWSAHGWRSRWPVNGSSKDIVELTIAPPVRAYVMGAPIKLQTLYVSVTDPQALIAACVPT